MAFGNNTCIIKGKAFFFFYFYLWWEVIKPRDTFRPGTKAAPQDPCLDCRAEAPTEILQLRLKSHRAPLVTAREGRPKRASLDAGPTQAMAGSPLKASLPGAGTEPRPHPCRVHQRPCELCTASADPLSEGATDPGHAHQSTGLLGWRQHCVNEAPQSDCDIQEGTVEREGIRAQLASPGVCIILGMRDSLLITTHLSEPGVFRRWPR